MPGRKLAILAVIFAACANNDAIAYNCMKMPPIIAMQGCCNYPLLRCEHNMIVLDIFKAVETEDIHQELKNCKKREKSYIALNLTKNGEADMEAVFDYIDTNIEADWIEITTSIFVECFRFMDEYKTTIDEIFASPTFNITKADCNYNYWVLEYCKDIELFLSCPPSKSTKLTESEVCQDSKEFFTACKYDEKTIRRFL